MLEERRPRPKRRVTGLALPASFGGVSTELTPELSAGLRRKLNALREHGAAYGLGRRRALTGPDIAARITGNTDTVL